MSGACSMAASLGNQLAMITRIPSLSGPSDVVEHKFEVTRVLRRTMDLNLNNEPEHSIREKAQRPPPERTGIVFSATRPF